MKIDSLSRRDVLKLIKIAPAAFLFNKLIKYPYPAIVPPQRSGAKNNIIILLLDTLSAVHTSLYGYGRATTPNLERFAQRAIVYHSHYSAGNYTVPGTASLLTGLYPWTHRANHFGGLISTPYVDHNIYKFIGSDRFRAGFSQNPYADLFLFQFRDHLDFHENNSKYNLMRNSLYSKFFPNDAVIAYHGLDGFSMRQNSGVPGAQILSALNNYRLNSQNNKFENQYKNEYPLGLPFIYADTCEPYTLADIFTGAQEILSGLPAPFFAYLHLYPPHGPYLPSRNYLNSFQDDGWNSPEKPAGVFPATVPHWHIQSRLREYDEFLAATDSHLGQLIDYFETSGLFDNSYIFITSDHGELFERGIYGHANEYLYESIIKVPLLVSTPGQKGRMDIHAPTSNTDVLPTILSILGKELPESLEGKPLPGFNPQLDIHNPVFSFVAKGIPAKRGAIAFTVTMIWGIYKLIYYSGYKNVEDTYELYDLKYDPDEMNNLYKVNTEPSKTMQRELHRKLNQIDLIK